MRNSVVPIVAVVASAALALAGCDAVDASKSGGGTLPITIQLATGDPQGRESSTAVELFAREIEERSRGNIRVEVLWQSFLGADGDQGTALHDYTGDTYTEVARQVEDGEVELAVVPDFAWVDRGARSVEALKVPFLIDSVDLMAEIARRLDVVPLAALEERGVTPLALLPEALRHPVGFDRPLAEPADFEGAGIRSVDVTVWPSLQTWGATPIAVAGSYATEVLDGSIVGTESTFALANSLPRLGVYTGDVTHMAKFTTLTAGTEWWRSLSAAQRSVIEESAAATLDGVLATLPDDATAGAEYCASGGAVVHAGERSRSELEAAVAPLIARLRADPVTADVVASITGLKAELPPAVVAAACTPASTASAQPGDPAETSAFPQGTYRAELTVEDFTSRGISLEDARNHAGVWTLTFRDGQVWDIECPGSTYSVRDARISIVLARSDPACGDAAGGELFSAAWTFDGDTLRFHDIGPGVEGPAWQRFSEVLWGSQDWVKIG